MNSEKQHIIEWVKTHKKELIAAGIGIAAVIALVVICKNYSSIDAVWRTLRGAIKKTANTQTAKTTIKNPIKGKGGCSNPVKTVQGGAKAAKEIVKEPIEHAITPSASTSEVISQIERAVPNHAVEVCDHIRNLPVGQHASPEKIITAAEHGFDLGPGQTWVENYKKYATAA